mgnify:FL=1
MESIVNTIPGYRVYEYLLVLRPHEDLSGRIIKIKEGFAEKFKTGQATGGKPYLALASFNQLAMLEERIMHALHKVAMGFPPFKITLKDFGSFPAHTIYLNVTSKLPVQQLVKTVRTEAQRLMKMNEENKPYFIMEPHFNIARKLKPWQYEKGWLEYSQKHFTGHFIASGMQLLKRPAGEKKYQLAAGFSFENLPVTTKQGELF